MHSTSRHDHRLALLLAGLLLFLGFLPTAYAQSSSPSLSVGVQALNVRSGPGVNYPVIGGLKLNDTVPIVGKNTGAGWWQIQMASARTGWVSGSSALVRVAGDTAATPEVAAPARSAAPAAVAPAPAASTRPGNKIVFQTSSGGPIYAVNPDGTGLRQLTSGIDPALSPDGKWVAFTRWLNQSTGSLGDVWVINLDGTGERKVQGEVRQPKSPAWSPDGTQLAINMQEGGRLDPKRVCGYGYPPRSAYDIEVVVDESGRPKICYTLAADPGWGLRIVNVADGSSANTPRDMHSFAPAWDPANAWRLVYSGDQGLVNLDINRWATYPLTSDVNDRSAAFSPDGSKIAVSYHQHDHWEIHVMNADGSGRVRLTDTPASVLADQILKGEERRLWNNAAPAWSPDGKQIAFVSDRSGKWDFWIMNADGSNPHLLFQNGMANLPPLQYAGVDERVISWR